MLNKSVYALMSVGALLFTACDRDSASANSAVSELCVLSSRSDVSGYIVTCAGDSVATLNEGKDGASCSVSALSDSSGYKIACDGDSVGVLLNGATGASGKNGSAGVSCGVSPLSDSSGYKIVCGDDSVGVLLNATTDTTSVFGDSCTLVDNGDGTVTQTCVLYKAKCGDVPYDPTKKFCVDSVLYNLCGTSSYKPASQFCDSRNSVVYGKVKIGSAVWMSQNLYYKTTNSSCYGDSSKCSASGRLYPWTDASVACPSGWHLPTAAEWTKLSSYVDGKNGDEGVGTSLKAQSGWLLAAAAPEGTNRYGFKAIAAGYFTGTKYTGADSSAYFWSSSASSADATLDSAYSLLYNDAALKSAALAKTYGLSVRCVQN